MCGGEERRLAPQTHADRGHHDDHHPFPTSLPHPIALSDLLASNMRAKHTSHPLKAFPVYSIAFISDDEVILGGGGGAGRAGIKNKMVRAKDHRGSSRYDVALNRRNCFV